MKAQDVTVCTVLQGELDKDYEIQLLLSYS